MEKKDSCLYVSLAQRPTIEVLHCYILIGGKVRVRANISHYVEGEKFGDVHCFDDTTRKAKWWVVLTGPVSWPPHDILRRGFQGFRYTGPLWEEEL